MRSTANFVKGRDRQRIALRSVKQRRGSWPQPIAFAACLFWCGISFAQGPGGHPGGFGGPGAPGGGPGMGGRTGLPGEGRPPGRPGAGPAPPGPGTGSGTAPVPGTRGPLQQGPGGRWWDEGKYARTVGLTGDQQRRMDSVFSENRSTLVSNLDNLRRAQVRLDAVSKSDHPSEANVLAEIQNVAQARADLEKANTHMLLQLRNEMTAEQWNKLEKLK